MSDPARIYQLKIELPYIKPSIWRRLEVRGQMTFSDLHNAIQIAMGWEDCHLWFFSVDKTEISPESEQIDFPGRPRARSADSTTLDAMLKGRCIDFDYEYDMGDSWTHKIKVEKILSLQSDVQYPRCTGGERACPPEDCGGFHGYLRLLEAMTDSKHPEHDEMIEWIGEQWNPEVFDLDAVNKLLQPRRRKSAKRAKK